jgi:DNA-binding transcriptional LysR family regulator
LELTAVIASYSGSEVSAISFFRTLPTVRPAGPRTGNGSSTAPCGPGRRTRVAVNSVIAYIAYCLAGLDLIQIPAYDVRRHVESGELVEVMPGHRAQPMPMMLLYPHRQHYPASFRSSRIGWTSW